MDPDEANKFVQSYIEEANTGYSVNIGNISPYTIDISKGESYDWITIDDTTTRYDSSYGIEPVKNNPEVYTCHEQREKHEKYPALKQAWEDYLNMYNLTQGEPPIVD